MDSKKHPKALVTSFLPRRVCTNWVQHTETPPPTHTHTPPPATSYSGTGSRRSIISPSSLEQGNLKYDTFRLRSKQYQDCHLPCLGFINDLFLINCASSHQFNSRDTTHDTVVKCIYFLSRTVRCRPAFDIHVSNLGYPEWDFPQSLYTITSIVSSYTTLNILPNS